MRCIVVVFNRDLRVRDHPALHEAVRQADTVIPLFVLDDNVLAGAHRAPNRLSFLLDGLTELRESLRSRHGDLVVARGDTVATTMRLARDHDADGVYVSADVSRYSVRREQELAFACASQRLDFAAHPGVTVVPAGELRPAGGDHYRVFTPYWRAWTRARRRRVLPPPATVSVPAGLDVGSIPRLQDLTAACCSPQLPTGGEVAGRRLLRSWGSAGLEGYGDRHDDLAGDATSRISPYLHYGFVSPLEITARFDDRAGAGSFLRQLCWRDFHHQVTAAFGPIATEEYRPRGDPWRTDAEDFEVWTEGRTGYPIVDAGMRQLRHEGWMHNRARLITASFLAKHLYIDWRWGAAHFLDWLVDGDIANNSGNWQWVAGTGNDSRPHRMFNPLRQADRFDPAGDYVRRYVPELAGVAGGVVHRPWELEPAARAELDYPEPIIELGDAVHRFRESRPRS